MSADTPGEPLRLTDVLDPRPAEQAAQSPIPGAVNIPFAELPRRTHELPPKDALLRVAGPPALAAEVAAWLERGGRRAAPVTDQAPAAGKGDRRPCQLWRPNGWLAEALPHLPPGAALDLGCGTGRDAVYLASRGWHVTAVDSLPDALDRGRDLERRYAGDAHAICWVAQDLEAAALNFPGRFSLITMFRYLHRPLLGRLTEWLERGGSVLCEVFTTLQRERHGQPARAADVVMPGELPRLLPGLAVRGYREAWYGGDHTARLWAVWADPAPQAARPFDDPPVRP